MSTIRSILRQLEVTRHRLGGVFWFHCGAHLRARRHFERVLELKGDDFSAFVHLGRLAYGLGDYAGWRRECENARRTSPERFARLKHPFELPRSRNVGAIFEETGERATWRGYRAINKVGGAPQAPKKPERLDTSVTPNPHDDCASEFERRRFDSLGPLTRGEIREADLDELVRRLGS